RRIAQHVMRIHQREDEAERLGQAGLAQPALHLPRVVLVPTLAAEARAAAAEGLGLGVAAGVWRLPLAEAVVALEPRRVRLTPLPPDRLRQVPLALEHHVIAALPQQRAERGNPRLELR